MEATRMAFTLWEADVETLPATQGADFTVHGSQVWGGGAELPDVPADLGRTVVTIGVFDGVHRGHQRIVYRALARAAELRLPAVAITFDPMPEYVLRPETKPAMLTTVPRRLELLGELGLDGVYVIHFTEELAAHSPEEFVQLVLVDKLHVVDVVVGANFRFGRRAAGDVATLTELGRTEAGFMVDAVELTGPDPSGLRAASTGQDPDSTGQDPDSQVYSSSWIRGRIAVGDVESAAEALGRPHRLEGRVIHGDHRGRELGYPTANLELPPALAVPADGVYAGWLDGMPAAISVGTNPTFGAADRRVEAYVIDKAGLDLYGQVVALDFVTRLRPMVAFDGIEGLVAQMAVDVEQSRAFLSAKS
jgi:riboflavin kinase / FMN adenylyltransferase